MRCAFSVPEFPKSHSDRTFIRLSVHLTRFFGGWSPHHESVPGSGRLKMMKMMLPESLMSYTNTTKVEGKWSRWPQQSVWNAKIAERTHPRGARDRPWQLFRSKGEGGTNNLPRGGRCGRISESVSSCWKRLDEKIFHFCFKIKRLFFHY